MLPYSAQLLFWCNAMDLLSLSVSKAQAYYEQYLWEQDMLQEY